MSSAVLKSKYEPLFTIREVATIFKLSPAAVRHLIKNGELQAIRIGKQFRIPQSIIDSYFTPFQSPESPYGFGLLKGKKFPRGVVFENKARRVRKPQSLEKLVKELNKIK